ncbi:hypothetical protein FIBSPDRAFT_962121 [Athelia psychrophila]|uniref:Uncharacterized protein n=1 Tax=Athelia psychrophila TaxID=1759441 RepID=A0A166AGC9_9AGAM|nr:hypothetical protein FIBSPDRAFT_962121 [Fibularhizoctonia sp. CBS 109695]
MAPSIHCTKSSFEILAHAEHSPLSLPQSQPATGPIGSQELTFQPPWTPLVSTTTPRRAQSPTIPGGSLSFLSQSPSTISTPSARPLGRWDHQSPETMQSGTPLRTASSVKPSHCSKCFCTDRRERVTLAERYSNISDYLCVGRVSPTDYLIHLMEAMDDRTVSFKQGLYQQDGGLGRFLDQVVADHKGWERLREWMEPHAYERVRFVQRGYAIGR